MKKLALLLLSVITLSSCSVDDDGPYVLSRLAKVNQHELPEYFEKGKSYDVEVSYLLPDLCHQPVGLQLSRGNDYGDERRDIYVAGVVNYNADETECTLEPEDESELTVDTTFKISIDESEPYTFYFWTGVDFNGENVFEVVEVPVGAPVVDETE